MGYFHHVAAVKTHIRLHHFQGIVENRYAIHFISNASIVNAFVFRSKQIIRKTEYFHVNTPIAIRTPE